VQQLCKGSDGVDLVFDSVLGPYFDPLCATAGRRVRVVLCSRSACRYSSMRRGGTMVVFGAASFIKPGFVSNYLHLAVDYLRRPRCDVLEMISQNKGVFGFNLIWCVRCCLVAALCLLKYGSGCGIKWR
jgi:alcohol dehydrogenase